MTIEELWPKLPASVFNHEGTCFYLRVYKRELLNGDTAVSYNDRIGNTLLDVSTSFAPTLEEALAMAYDKLLKNHYVKEVSTTQSA